MRNIVIFLAMLASGCVFQASPEIPADRNDVSNNISNNISNNSTNNVTNNVSNNSTNNAPNNTTNNTTTGPNNTALPDCSPQPEFCEGYFLCGSGTTDDLDRNPCHYDCGMCPADAQCFSAVELCSSKDEVVPSPRQDLLIKDLASSRKDIVVWWSDDSLSLVLPDGLPSPVTFADVELAPDVPITAISSSATRWVAIGQAGASMVTLADRGAKFTTLQGVSGSDFGTSLDLALTEKASPLGPTEYGMGVVGAPGATDAKVIARSSAADWHVIQSLVESLPDANPPSAFGDRVAISPQGRTILVNSSNGVEAFHLVDAAWAYDKRIPNPGQGLFGAHIAVGEGFAVVASDRFLNVVRIDNQDRVRADAVEVIKTGDDTEILDLEVISGLNNSTVIFALVKLQGNTIIQMWQRGSDRWFLSNTVSPANFDFDTFDVVEGAVFDQPTVSPGFTVSGTRDDVSKTRIFPLVVGD